MSLFFIRLPKKKDPIQKTSPPYKTRATCDKVQMGTPYIAHRSIDIKSEAVLPKAMVSADTPRTPLGGTHWKKNMPRYPTRKEMDGALWTTMGNYADVYDTRQA